MADSADSDMAGRPPLSGLKVLDFTRVIAGPYMTAMLADMGADVVKVEDPRGGDDSRSHNPPGRDGQAAVFLALNRSKASVAIDLRTEAGRDLIRQMAADCDVLVENFRPGTMKRLGLDHETLARDNPRLITCAISGYGKTTPYGPLAGYDPIVQAETGYMYMTGDASMPPIRAGGSVIDVLTGMQGLSAVLAALHHRAATGRGQSVDVSLFDTALSSLGYMLQGPLLTGENPERLGNTSFFMAPNGLYDCRDGQIMLSAGNDRLFARLCAAMGLDDMAADPCFATNRARLENLNAMNARLGDRLREEDRTLWVDRFRKAGVPAGAVRAPLEALASDEARSSGMIHSVDHPVVGAMDIVGHPVRYGDTPARPPRPAPMLGAQTRDVLADRLGLTAEMLDRLEAEGAIGAATT